MPKAKTVDIKGNEYELVGSRVGRFRDKYTIDDGWGIVTKPMATGDIVCVRAAIVSPGGGEVATGYAEKVRGSDHITSSSALEFCETSAIGRALAAAGFAGTEYASADEMVDALKQQSSGGPGPSTPRTNSSGDRKPSQGRARYPCPRCKGEMYDNRDTAKGNQPKFRCKNYKKCDGAVWKHSRDGSITDAYAALLEHAGDDELLNEDVPPAIQGGYQKVHSDGDDAPPQPPPPDDGMPYTDEDVPF